ncbi:cyanase [Pseudooceanicola sp. CBS1P-1]|uniref:Cyanate hydratase n=1 Tax=Pseudooceanicola albus TaxID=2692189 RepID=A0A6L7G661_9RHOB|nr:MULTISPECIES: cyanase [Pseudooceanicola]MBT9385571.1 cyanase [Pseudooceanicola endophyticus]MXN19017.1 cyanase [Pseudooceanicola albus]
MKDIPNPEDLTREDVTALILSARRRSKRSWEGIAEAIGMSPVWTHSCAMGMNAMPLGKAQALVALLDLPEAAVEILTESPTKIWTQAVPTDPCIYRFYEVVGVYGPTLKALIHEKFGDGIMSAIDFDMEVNRIPHPKGDRVEVKMSGKYLSFNAW